MSRLPLTREVSARNDYLWGEINKDPNPYNSFCTNGKLANYYLLLNKPVPYELDEALRSARKKYWLEQQTFKDFSNKTDEWMQESQESIALELEIGDRIGLQRDIYWLEQDMWLLNQADDPTFKSKLENAQILLDETRLKIKEIPLNTRGVLLDNIIESTPVYKELTNNIVRKWIYMVDTGKGLAPAEVIYTGLDIGKPESDRGSILCAPISIGCPAGCRMCQIGEIHLNQLSADQMLTMVFRTVKGYSLPRLFPENLKISWLGGGDPAFNMPEFKKAVERVHDFYPKSTQVVSTVGVSERTLSELIELQNNVPELSLQVSLLSLNPDFRRQLIPLKKIPSPEKVFDLIKKNTTQKKIYISLMLFNEMNETPDSILKYLKDYNVDPKSIHITLNLPTSISDTTLSSQSEEKYEQVKKTLEEAGFETHIYKTPELAFEELGGCGVLTTSTKKKLRSL